MATAVARPAGRSDAGVDVRRVDVITGLLAMWMTIGVYIDGFAHTHLIETLEGFITPWHAILYSGFTVVAVWIALHRDRPGYGLGFAGVIVFAAGGAFDAVWHTLLGIENDFEALISPAHLFLFVGHLLIASTPLRAAWASRMQRAPGWSEFAPVAISFLAVVGVVSFMFMYLTPFNDWLPSARFQSGVFDADSPLRLAQKGAAGQYLWATVMYSLPLLAILTRWRPPFGAATLAIGLPAIGIAAIDPLLLGAPQLALAGVGMGFLADVLIARLDPSPRRTGSYLIFGALAPLPLTVISLALIGVRWGVGWSTHMVTGIVTLSAFAGFAMAVLLSLPTQNPEEAHS
jgi:hypothetical protein